MYLSTLTQLSCVLFAGVGLAASGPKQCKAKNLHKPGSSTWSQGYHHSTSTSSSTGYTASPSSLTERNTRCYTTLDSTSAAYTTRSTTTYTPCTSTATVPFNITIPLPTGEDTSTVIFTTTVTESTVTDTATDTSITTEIITSTATTVATTISFTTVTSTSVVPASTGFLPVQSTLPGSSYSGSGGSDPLAKRSLHSLHPARANSTDDARKPIVKTGDMYPREVLCVEYAQSDQCETMAITQTSLQTLDPMTAVTVTLTRTSTFYPSATTTITVTDTDTKTSTVTATSFATITGTSFVAGPTLYAACASNNLADTVQGRPIGEGGPGFPRTGFTRASTSADSAYECCVAALLAGYKEESVAVYAPYYNTINQDSCFYFIQDSCPSQAASAWDVYLGDGGIGQLTVSNLNCGLWNDLGN